MAKSKTKTDGSKPATRSTSEAAKARRDLDAERREIEDAIRARATDRARKWSRLVELLDAMLDQAHALDRFGIPLDPKLVADHAHANGVPLSWARKTIELSTHAELVGELRIAHNRLATIEGYVYGSCDESAVGELASIIEGKQTNDTPQRTIAGAIKEVESLLRADLDDSRALVAEGKPAQMERAVISVLLHATRSLTQEEIADEMTEGRNCEKLVVDAKGVSEAMRRLRERCGYSFDKRKGGGFRLTDEAVSLAKLHGLEVPKGRRTQSE